MTEAEISFSSLLQANIFKPDGRNYRRYLFVRLNEKAHYYNVETFIEEISRKYLSSQLDQERSTLKYKKAKRENKSCKDPGIVNIGLSIHGFNKLNAERFSGEHPGDRSFRNGMRDSENRLHDYNSWRRKGRNSVDGGYFNDLNPASGKKRFPAIDLVIMIGHTTKKGCKRKSKKIQALLKENKPDIVASYFKEDGFQLRNEKTGIATSPLGFQEGFSNKVSAQTIRERMLVHEDWAVFKDENNNVIPTYGSYMAFRKIEVREHVFETLIDKLVDRLREKEPDKDEQSLRAYAKALYMGRFQNGTPVVINDEELEPALWSSSGQDLPFDYKKDPSGLRCPFGAHVRRMNPIGSGEKRLVILRRGMLFRDKNSKRSGLLFVSFQGSIDRQFEPLFDRMAAPRHPDAIAYRPEVNSSRFFTEFEIAERYDRGKIMGNIKAGGRDLTTFRGGEYFFLPSVKYLKGLE